MAERFVTKTAFLEMLGQQNMASILTAAKQSVDIEVWVMRFNAAPEIDLNYHETIGGLQALEGLGILTPGTYASIYPTAPTGVSVRVLPPWDTAYPDVYEVATQSDDVWSLDIGVDFAPEYLEVVE